MCEWKFCNWAVHNIDGDHKETVIIISNLLNAKAPSIRIQKFIVPG